MTVAGLITLSHNTRALKGKPATAPTVNRSVSEPSWCLGCEYEWMCFPHLSHLEPGGKRGVPMTQNNHEIMGSAAA